MKSKLWYFLFVVSPNEWTERKCYKRCATALCSVGKEESISCRFANNGIIVPNIVSIHFIWWRCCVRTSKERCARRNCNATPISRAMMMMRAVLFLSQIRPCVQFVVNQVTFNLSVLNDSVQLSCSRDFCSVSLCSVARSAHNKIRKKNARILFVYCCVVDRGAWYVKAAEEKRGSTTIDNNDYFRSVYTWKL